MSYEKNNTIINQIIKNSRLSTISDLKLKASYISRNGITIIGKENIDKYRKGISLLHKYNKNIETTISSSYFEERITNIIKTHLTTNTLCTIEEIKELFDAILLMPVIEREVLFFLKGAKLDTTESSFGEFKLYKYPDSKELLTKKYPNFEEHNIFFNKPEISEALIGITVSTRESTKAIEIADHYVQAFENVVNYILGDINHIRSVGVFTHRPWSSVSRILCSETLGVGYHMSNILSGSVNFKKNDNNGVSENNKLFRLITNNNKTELEKRILNAVEWAGKACIDFDNSKALVQLVFAIEGMLKFDDGSLITPSIISQIGDWLAFINSDDATNRLEIANQFKRIYKKRSAVAHGGNSDIEFSDISIALQLVKMTINTFLNTEPYVNMKTVKELSNHINELKYK